jgi:hypothetical protein
MTEETNAQTLAGLAEGTTTTTAAPETNTQPAENGKPENDTEATNSTVTEQEAADTGAQPDDDDDSETDGQDDRPRRRSRSDRYKSRIAAQAARIAELEGLVSTSGKEAPKAPRLEDFNYDQQAYEDARLAFNTEQAVNKAIGETQKQERESKIREARQELVEEFTESVSRIKERITDYDAVMDSCKIDLRKDVADLILSSEKGAHLAYELAKNNGAKLREIQSLPPVEAARAVGRLEARLSLPTPKKQTQAPTPIKPPVGGAAPSRDLETLAKSENPSEYIRMMNERERKKA